MLDTLASALKRKCGVEASEAKRLAQCARQNLDLPETFLWSRELEKEAIRLHEQNSRCTKPSKVNTSSRKIAAFISEKKTEPSPSKQDAPEVRVVSHQHERHAEEIDQQIKPKIVSPRRKSTKKSISEMDQTGAKSPVLKTTRTGNSKRSPSLAQDNALIDESETEKPVLTEKTVPSLLPPMRMDSYCTVDSLFSSDSTTEDFARAEDWTGLMQKSHKWSTLHQSPCLSKENTPARSKNTDTTRDARPKRPVRKKSYDVDDFDQIMKAASDMAKTTEIQYLFCD